MITLTAPAGQIIVLPDPKLKDGEIWELRTQIDRSMDGTFRSFITAPPITKFKLEFENMNRKKVIELEAFLKATSDVQITYLDYIGQSHFVSIMNDPFQSTHQGISNTNFTLELEVLN